MRLEILPELLREARMPSIRSFLTRAGQFGPVNKMTPELRDVAHKMYRKGMELSQTFVVAVLADTEELPEYLIPTPLARSARISLFCATLGKGLDEAVESLFQKDKPLEGALLDAWGSEAVEQMAQNVDSLLRARHGKGTMRFSPGYGDFSVLHNGELLRYLSSESATLPLFASAETGILTPRKSVVCMIGWEPSPHPGNADKAMSVDFMR